MKKCYDKQLNYIIPHLKCSFCNSDIKPGDGIYSVIITWGDGRTACRKCYDEYEIDWSLHKTQEEDDEE